MSHQGLRGHVKGRGHGAGAMPLSLLKGFPGCLELISSMGLNSLFIVNNIGGIIPILTTNLVFRCGHRFWYTLPNR